MIKAIKWLRLWEKCGLTRSWNDPQKDIGRKNSDLNGKFLVGQVDGVLMASIMIGYDGHRGSINYLAVDPDYAARGLWQDFDGRG